MTKTKIDITHPLFKETATDCLSIIKQKAELYSKDKLAQIEFTLSVTLLLHDCAADTADELGVSIHKGQNND